MRIKTTKIRCTKEELRAAIEVDEERRAAVIFFLLGAERENAMFQGRRANEALAAAIALLRIPPEQLRALREAIV